MITLEYLRQFRVGPFTIFDTVLSYVGIFILSPVLAWAMSKLHLKVPIISWLWFTLPLSVIFHIIFRQSTPLMKVLSNPRQVPFYIATFILLAMSYMGMRSISKM